MEANLPAERGPRWLEILERPNLLRDICAHVSNGGTVPELSETWNIPAGWIFGWIHADPERDRLYLKALNDRAEWYEQRILAEIRRLGIVDAQDIFRSDGRLKPLVEWSRDARAAIIGIERKELYDKDGEVIGEVVKIKLADKLKALELLGKQIGMFQQRVAVSGTLKLEDLVAASKKEE